MERNVKVRSAMAKLAMNHFSEVALLLIALQQIDKTKQFPTVDNMNTRK